MLCLYGRSRFGKAWGNLQDRRSARFKPRDGLAVSLSEEQCTPRVCRDAAMYKTGALESLRKGHHI